MAGAIGALAGQPSLWVIGALGFALRGGLVVLTLPILVLPTPVEVRLLLGSNLGSAGLSPAFLGYLAQVGALLLVSAGAGLLLLAYLELVSFERLVRDPETADVREDVDPARPSSPDRLRLLRRLFAVQLIGAAVLAACALPLIEAVLTTTTNEILRPTPGGASIYLRVAGAVGAQALFLAGAVVVVEFVSALATRRLLVEGFGLAQLDGKRRLGGVLGALTWAVSRLLRHPVGVLGTAAAGWVASVVLLAPAAWGMLLAWDAVRSTYLAASGRSDVQTLTGMLIVTLALAGIFVSGAVLGGVASALRGGLWSVEALRRG